MSAEIPNYACDPEMWRDAEEDAQTCEDREYECCEVLTEQHHIEEFGYPPAGCSEDRDFDRAYDEWMDALERQIADEEDA